MHRFLATLCCIVTFKKGYKMLNLEELSKYKKQEDLFTFCKKYDKNIVIMPSGAHAQELFNNYLKPLGIKCTYFVDNDKTKHGSIIDGVEVISFEKLVEKKEDIKIIFATNTNIYSLLKKQLQPYNIESFYAAQQYCIYTKEEIHNCVKIITANYDRYLNLYNLLEDDLSKKTLDNHIKFRLSYDAKYLLEIQQDTNNQYFENGIYQISANDSFADCGAYTGDTLENALSRIDGTFKNYYAFEPDEKNFNILKEKASNTVEVFKAGCYSKTQILHMEGSAGSISKLSSSGGAQKINVVSLDEQLKDKDVTFIKMDIEGAEIEALKGAKNIITSMTPTLAICVYHKFNDIFDIPELIKSYNSNYKYYLRHYTDYVSETVLYAVKKENND